MKICCYKRFPLMENERKTQTIRTTTLRIFRCGEAISTGKMKPPVGWRKPLLGYCYVRRSRSMLLCLRWIQSISLPHGNIFSGSELIIGILYESNEIRSMMASVRGLSLPPSFWYQSSSRYWEQNIVDECLRRL